MYALGDSIAACHLADDGKPGSSAACAPDLIASELRDHYVPDLKYANYSQLSSQTREWLEQAQRVEPGPGHILIWAYWGGNDIGMCAQTNPIETLACADGVIAELTNTWQDIFTYFSDLARFPDGATFMLNTQYGLYDECVTPESPLGGPQRDAKLKEYNQKVFIQPALTRNDTVTVDQYPDWRGHERQADQARCPHCYRGDNSTWLASDGTHPNSLGQQHIADKWTAAIEAIYSQCE